MNLMSEKDIEHCEQFSTKRVIAPQLENILYQTFPILDHGFIRVIDYMGDDSAIVQAARVSYGRGTKKKSEDQALIKYLMRHRHTTPFEMCEIKFHLKMPLFVARQWLRHRTANVNEYSARYSIMDKEFYLPECEQMSSQSLVNNQGRGNVVPNDQALDIRNRLKRDAEQCYESYEYFLSEDENNQKFGLARELARMNLPVNFYTQMYWKIDLHNLLHFLSLRADGHAQYEIRVYAEEMLKIVEKWVPTVYEAFMQYRAKSMLLSKAGIDILKKKLKGEHVTQESSGLGKREWGELVDVFEDLEN
jgi:thymidylate synthase (FAD)